jgi:hypothetical protein
MQLREARLCLDCEELHNEDRCPACASDAFAFLTRWVPSTERRRTKRVVPPSTATPPPARKNNLIRNGVMGLAVVAAGRWLWKTSKPAPGSEVSSRQVNN